MSTLPLNIDSESGTSGFRLRTLEVFNWGTFDKKVWTVNPDGFNAFATGDVGSGKSTLVDAITTLLVPPRGIVYNKAAGAESKERDLTTYILGAYKTEKADDSHKGKAAYLRDDSSYSVLLAIFYNPDLNQSVTIAQVYRAAKTGPHERFYVCADQELKIERDFMVTGSGLSSLRRELRGKLKANSVHDTFSKYSAHFRSLMGIRSDQALDLFYQTVSMKSVENLTAFIREQMLDRWDFDGEVDLLCKNFEDLNKLHQTVVDAREQVAALKPIDEGYREIRDLQVSVETNRSCRELLSAFFAEQRTVLLEEKINALKEKEAKAQVKIDQKALEKESNESEQSSLLERIYEAGGSRLQTIGQLIEVNATARDERLRRFEGAKQNAELIGMEMPESAEAFYDFKTQLDLTEKTLREGQEKLQERRVDVSIKFSKARDEAANLNREIESLKRRSSNIPTELLQIRARICEALALDEEKLPFVGEVLQVKASERRWEGAAERVLGSFARSLLVPQTHYGLIAKYVNETNLRQRLVYFKADTATGISRAPRAENSLVNKLDIKSKSEFHDWLWEELCHRFDYVCSPSFADFQRQTTALTVEGQIKNGGKRHEKDDRRRLDDRSNYVLGWDSREKKHVLEQKLKEVELEGKKLGAEIAEIGSGTTSFENNVGAILVLKGITNFDDIDWEARAKAIESLESEKAEIESSNKRLSSLREKLEGLKKDNKLIGGELAKAHTRMGEITGDLKNAREALKESFDLVETVIPLQRSTFFPKIAERTGQSSLLTGLDLVNIEKRERDLRAEISSEIDNTNSKINRRNGTLAGLMASFLSKWKNYSEDLDANVDSIGGFQEILAKLEKEDLPRHEARFKQKLNEDTINGIAMFQEKLEIEAKKIRQKVDVINESLKDIDYSQGTFIKLVCERNNDPEIQAFADSLRSVISNTLGGDSLYSEEKFISVKSIVDRLKGREGTYDGDRRWRRKVSDVRNWFHFAADELYREDLSRKEYHPDTTGKSGGQKEQLAYTILAAALVYQYGLGEKTNLSRTFRLVVIDEAFGRGSDKSTKYALELFGKLNLQLFIVTPLQKVNVIEKFVNRVHFVHNLEGRSSQVRNLTIEEYREERDARERSARPGRSPGSSAETVSSL